MHIVGDTYILKGNHVKCTYTIVRMIVVQVVTVQSVRYIGIITFIELVVSGWYCFAANGCLFDCRAEECCQEALC